MLALRCDFGAVVSGQAEVVAVVAVSNLASPRSVLHHHVLVADSELIVREPLLPAGVPRNPIQLIRIVQIR